MFGFYRVAAATPELKVANVDFNVLHILQLAKEAEKKKVAIAVFPELAITGYTCADMFHQNILLEKTEQAILKIAKSTQKMKIVIVVGAPIRTKGRLYNCAVVIQSGDVLGVVPKSFLPNYREFYERRWFAEGIGSDGEVTIGEKSVPFGDRLIFEHSHFLRFGIEICEDLWNTIPPSSYHATAGATLILNPSASNELVAKSKYRKGLVTEQSARCIAGYVYTSSGVNESTTDLVYGGHQIIAENGVILAENERFQRKASLTIADIDCERLYYTKISESVHSTNSQKNYRIIKLKQYVNNITKIERLINPLPFVPANFAERNEHCEEIFNIQKNGLAGRIKHTGAKKVIIGISGGLDSTLALLVVKKTFELLKIPMKNLVTITMPGFGTSDRTYNNSVELCKILKSDFREINIKDICLRHFDAIGHDPDIHSVTYENVQARERTQLLMNIANKEKGLVVGTGDLSEIALGWSTYNGDHMSMYGLNCGVPKTLIRYLIQWVADHSSKKLKELLEDIIATPVSPELLPKHNSGKIHQKTEDILGPYELHDFFLYHTIKYGASPEKIIHLATMAFKRQYKKSEIKKYLVIFVKRFFSNQFKRSCIPDGPKVGTIALSPRGDWRMPSDASPEAWLEKIQNEINGK